MKINTHSLNSSLSSKRSRKSEKSGSPPKSPRSRKSGTASIGGHSLSNSPYAQQLPTRSSKKRKISKGRPKEGTQNSGT